MSDCETYEISISALADGELPAEDLLPTLDHLAECASCRAFYRDVRALAAALPADAGLASSVPPEAPEEIWHRIEAATAPAFFQRGRPGRAPSWALRAAVLLVAGLWGGLATVSALRPADGPIEVTLGDDGGRMTEQRFVDLTVELLRADSRYHQEMLQVLTTVVERGGRQEAPVDQDAPLPEGDDGASDDWGAARQLS
jgi:predicted anti-sigma-YlaC factor YlaD